MGVGACAGLAHVLAFRVKSDKLHIAGRLAKVDHGLYVVAVFHWADA